MVFYYNGLYFNFLLDGNVYLKLCLLFRELSPATTFHLFSPSSSSTFCEKIKLKKFRRCTLYLRSSEITLSGCRSFKCGSKTMQCHMCSEQAHEVTSVSLLLKEWAWSEDVRLHFTSNFLALTFQPLETDKHACFSLNFTTSVTPCFHGMLEEKLSMECSSTGFFSLTRH